MSFQEVIVGYYYTYLVVNLLSFLASLLIIITALLTPSLRIQLKPGSFSFVKIVCYVAVCDSAAQFSFFINSLRVNITLSYNLLCLTDSLGFFFESMSTLWLCCMCGAFYRLVRHSVSFESISRYIHRIHIAVVIIAALPSFIFPIILGWRSTEESEIVLDCTVPPVSTLFVVVFILIALTAVLFAYAKIRHELYESYKFAKAVELKSNEHRINNNIIKNSLNINSNDMNDNNNNSNINNYMHYKKNPSNVLLVHVSSKSPLFSPVAKEKSPMILNEHINEAGPSSLAKRNIQVAPLLLKNSQLVCVPPLADNADHIQKTNPHKLIDNHNYDNNYNNQRNNNNKAIANTTDENLISYNINPDFVNDKLTHPHKDNHNNLRNENIIHDISDHLDNKKDIMNNTNNSDELPGASTNNYISPSLKEININQTITPARLERRLSVRTLRYESLVKPFVIYPALFFITYFPFVISLVISIIFPGLDINTIDLIVGNGFLILDLHGFIHSLAWFYYTPQARRPLINFIKLFRSYEHWPDKTVAG